MKSRKKEVCCRIKKRRKMLDEVTGAANVIQRKPSRKHIYVENCDPMSKISDELGCEREEFARSM